MGKIKVLMNCPYTSSSGSDRGSWLVGKESSWTEVADRSNRSSHGSGLGRGWRGGRGKLVSGGGWLDSSERWARGGRREDEGGEGDQVWGRSRGKGAAGRWREEKVREKSKNPTNIGIYIIILYYCIIGAISGSGSNVMNSIRIHIRIRIWISGSIPEFVNA